MGAWEKLQLGWLDYTVVRPGKRATVDLGPAEFNTDRSQAIVAALPDREVTTTVGAPYEGSDFWYSGSGDDLDNSMVTAKPAGATSLTAKVQYDIEQDWDYAYAGYVDGQGQFVSLPTNRSTTTDPNGQNFGNGITGSTSGAWVDFTVDISSVPAGAQVGFRYWSDGAVAERGFLVDAVTAGGAALTQWSLTGFRATTGTETNAYPNAYIAENRTYTGYDAGLRTGPYNFGDPRREDWAERLPYQNGLLISYWNQQYGDNNVGAHPGAGLVLPIDAHPGLLYEPTDNEGTDRRNGESWRPRIQSYDSTFGLEKTDTVTLHDPDSGKAGTYGGLPAVSTFDDTKDWYVARGEQADADGWSGVDVPKTGTTIRVVGVSASGQFMKVQVN
jgi:immune inhibitor A